MRARLMAMAVPVGGWGPPAVLAVPDLQPSRLVVGGVGSAGDLTVGVAAGHPRFEVVLAVGGPAEITRADVHDPVREAKALKDLLFDAEHLLVHGVGLLGGGEAEHLDLGKLVNPVEATARAPVGAGLGAETVGEAGEPER